MFSVADRGLGVGSEEGVGGLGGMGGFGSERFGVRESIHLF